jgi:hypothetical protein
MAKLRSAAGSGCDLLSAYRVELARRPAGTALAPDDGDWLVIGTLLGHAADASSARRSRLLSVVRDRLRAILGEAAWAMGSPIDPAPPPNAAVLAPRVRVLCERVEDADAAIFADALLGMYLGSGDPVSALERGRFDALRARLAWKRGDHEIAEEHYRQVEKRAAALGSAELETRAAIGYALVARLRGNYPASRAAAERATAIAEANGLHRLAALGHHALMVVAATVGQWDLALRHAWLAFEDVRGDPIAEATQLVDMAQLFYNAGHYDLATAGFTTALRQPIPHRVLLPALGGAALAAARRGESGLVASYAERARSQGGDSTLHHATAASWLDVAEACLLVGDTGRSESLREAALGLASSHAYHELVYRAEHLAVPARPSVARAIAFSDESREIGHAVQELAGAAH